MKMGSFRFCVFYTFSLLAVSGDEQADKQGYPSLSEGYLNIFKNMPLLYEYIHATLTKNPEVLECSQTYYPGANIYDYVMNNDEPVNDDDDENMNNENNVKRNANNDLTQEDINKSDAENYFDDSYDDVSNSEHLELDNYKTDINKRENDNHDEDSSVDPNEIKEKAIWAEEELEKNNS
ncbi:transcription initiation factor TFIID subunit 11-like [Amyelois transitella]|uniref:transcription initiation factor TFIID subunit 11-like n=1 Tax=Amyelois transitella TaxID=680683 RepID=UPI00299049EF|nr:transcription initiation factor TFIID subunit 11-like [Amyelois transitella]